MRKGLKRTLRGMAVVAAVIGLVLLVASRHYAVLEPAGTIARQQKTLLIFATILSLTIILPVFWLTFHIVRHYRVGAKRKAPYTPDWDGSRKLETLWWGVPALLILVLSIVTWQSSHSLDPYRPIGSADGTQTPVTIQVVALPWKWLFLYPNDGIASVNYLRLPVNRPVNFRITADAPMNSFWIPRLGGQVYAMTGMTSQLHLMATQAGKYRGSSANISGEGFAGMHFTAEASDDRSYQDWLDGNHQSGTAFDSSSYNDLARPSKDTPPATYHLTDDDLYQKIIDKYMSHNMDQDTKQGSRHAAME